MINNLKKNVSLAVLKYIKKGDIIGIGTGTTVSYFIDALSSIKNKIEGVVSSSIISTNKLKYYNIPIFDSNEIDIINLYVDSSDEINNNMQMIKGKGAALTREKIIATISKIFICIVDESKQVDILGNKCPLPIEVIPMARSYVSREMIKLGGLPIYRENTITDNNNIILDVYNLNIKDPVLLENHINCITGVVEVGLFAKRCADIVLMSNKSGIKIIKKFN